jgi:hypothetical protein
MKFGYCDEGNAVSLPRGRYRCLDLFRLRGCAKEGVHYTFIEARSMLAGAIALGVYSHLVLEFMAHRKRSALLVSMGLLSVWFAVAFGLYVVVFR